MYCTLPIPGGRANDADGEWPKLSYTRKCNAPLFCFTIIHSPQRISHLQIKMSGIIEAAKVSSSLSQERLELRRNTVLQLDAIQQQNQDIVKHILTCVYHTFS